MIKGTETFYTDGCVAQRVYTLQQVVNAMNANFAIVDENGEDFTFSVEDENGERESTEKETFDRIAEAMQKGTPVYAAFYLDCGTVVPDKATTLQSEYCAGEEVYYVNDDKIWKSRIETIQLAKSYYKSGGEYISRTENRIKLRNGEVKEESEIAKSKIEMANKLIDNAEERGI